ncbi:hypothetical protein AUP68_02858 [Ilyonectria robusta]
MSASCFFRPEEGRAASRRRNVFWAGSRPSPLAGANSTHRRWLAPGSGTLDWNNVDRALLDTDADAIFQLVTCLPVVLLSCRVRCVAGDATVDIHDFPTVTSRTRGKIVHILLPPWHPRRYPGRRIPMTASPSICECPFRPPSEHPCRAVRQANRHGPPRGFKGR